MCNLFFTGGCSICMQGILDEMTATIMHGFLKLRDEFFGQDQPSATTSMFSGCTGMAGVSKAVDRMRTTFMHGFLKLRDESSVRINHPIGVCYRACGIFCVRGHWQDEDDFHAWLAEAP